MLLQSIKLRNFLSFGPDAEVLSLRPLNVLIGPNGSGKSNLLEAISLLRAAPKAIAEPVREGGGVRDWIWKGGEQAAQAEIEAVVENPVGKMPLRYSIAFRESRTRFEIVDERVENELPYPGNESPYFYYRYERNHPVLNVKGTRRELRREEVDPEQSILSQRRDPDQYPEITYLGDVLGRIRLYRDWAFGRYTPPRLSQKADLPNDFLLEDCRNLGLILNSIRLQPPIKTRFLECLSNLYEGVDDFDVQVEGGSVQVFLQEGRTTIPATRLSDGTLRYLCLLAILCHPKPPPLVCIEEPELGLHPDVLASLAELLVDASQRCQLIVTTHSDFLVDAFTDTPDRIVVCEKHEESSTLRRLDTDELKPWLEKYRLGDLWTRGDLGGTRW